MDRILAFLLIIIVSPILLILLMITFLAFKCNPIFVQTRTVNGKSEFKFYKIRSMSKLAPNVPTDQFIGADKYISFWGRFLRIYSLDELLNLICIIKGDMNFIGPRPIMSCEAPLLSLRVENGINGKAGITGLAQINGRDLITIKRKLACERYYHRNRGSIKLRIYILCKTILVVIRKTGITH
jgi:lipopolysaccharide/colanic/teichoic acid biosynthesis glycosyltransferase